MKQKYPYTAKFFASAQGMDDLEVMLKYAFIRGCEEYGIEVTSESRVDKAERRKDLSCSFCPPNRKENAKRKVKSDVHKTKRKGKR